MKLKLVAVLMFVSIVLYGVIKFVMMLMKFDAIKVIGG